MRRALFTAALLAASALAGVGAAAVSAAARTEAAPPWQAAQRMQDFVFDAQSALLLDEPRSAVGLVRRGRAQLHGPLARGLRGDARQALRAVALLRAGRPRRVPRRA